MIPKLGTYTPPLLDRQIESLCRPVGWLDVFFPQGTPKTTGAGNPSLVTWIGNIRGFAYAVNDAHDFDPQEYPHLGKVGTEGIIHLHFVSRTNVAAARGVKWQVEFTQASFGTVFPATTIISVDVTIPAGTTANTHFIVDVGKFTTLGPGSLMAARLTRIASAVTAPADDPVVLGLHYHFLADAIGSRTPFAK